METLIFMIIIGVLSAIFGKGKIAKNQSTSKPFFPSGFEEIKTLINKQMDNSQSRTIHNEAAKPSRNIQKSIETQYLRIRNQQEQELEAAQFSTTQTNHIVEPLIIQKIEDEKVNSEQWNSQTVINGLIWSEILGEPRSKKPYFARKG